MTLAEQAQAEAQELIADVRRLLGEAQAASRQLGGTPHLLRPEHLLELLTNHRSVLCGVLCQAERVKATLGAAAVCRQLPGEAVQLPDRKRLAAHDLDDEPELFQP
jgi:hypothetical protein